MRFAVLMCLSVLVVASSPFALAKEARTHAPWTLDSVVGDVVAERPATARIFELVGIDYCCGGKQTLAAVAAQKKIEPQVLLSALLVVGTDSKTPAAKSWAREPLPDLIQHLETTHHAYLRRELPRLSKIVATVHRVHRAKHPELDDVKRIYDQLAAELPVHLKAEETKLFPAIRRAAAGPVLADVLNHIEQLTREHDTAGEALHALRALTKNYVVPEGACRLYKEMLRSLVALERDMHTHVHLENSVLFPRVGKLVAKSRKAK